jgi:type IV pilus assembly protein PilV
MKRLLPQRGFSLIEVLVTMLILAIGLMGLAGLQARMVATELEAYQRAQALMIAHDMANRLRANPNGARQSHYSGSQVYGVGSSFDSDCSEDEDDGVMRDLCNWSSVLKGAAAEDKDGLQIGAMIGGRGCIETLSGNSNSQVLIRVTVAWQGLSPSAQPSLDCGVGNYGDERLRRSLALIVSLPYLGI